MCDVCAHMQLSSSGKSRVANTLLLLRTSPVRDLHCLVPNTCPAPCLHLRSSQLLDHGVSETQVHVCLCIHLYVYMHVCKRIVYIYVYVCVHIT
jgi:hypothetical protein